MRSISTLQKLLACIVLLASFSAYSASSYSEDSLRKIYLEMRFLYQLGVNIHQKYDLNDRAQINQCISQEGYNATRARALIGATNRIEYPDKKMLVDAAWAAYSCASCKGDGSICDTIPGYLKNIKQVGDSIYKSDEF